MQQPPPDYVSTDHNVMSVMTANSDSKSSMETRYWTRGRKKDKKGRLHRHCSQTTLTSLRPLPPRYCSKYRTRSSGSRKPDKRVINLTNCPHCKDLAAMALPTHRQRMYRIQNATTKRSVRVGDHNGYVRRSASPTRSMTTAMNDGVGI